MLLAALALQLLLGMSVNLWVHIPAQHAGAHAVHYFAGVGQVIAWALGSGATMLQLHVATGLLLLVGGSVALVLAVRTRRPGWIWATAIGLSGILGAGFNGASFLIFNYNFSSFLMTAAFVIAAASYTVGICAAP